MSPRAAAAAIALLSLGLTGGAAAKTVEHKAGQFQITFPDHYGVKMKEARLIARSNQGNVLVIARAHEFKDADYDFTNHFARWEWNQAAKKRAISRLRAVVGTRRVGGKGHEAFYRVYDAVSKRKGVPQPYRVFTMAAHNKAAKKVYTLVIAAHREFFQKNRARLLEIASTFRPLGVPASAVAEKPREAGRVSLRGLLGRKGRVVAPPPKK
jgi:hypothetical protein